MWKPNRRFLRDGKQLTNQNHNLTYNYKPNGSIQIYINGNPVSYQEVYEIAKAWRRPITQEEIDKAKAEAYDLWQKLKDITE